jgi:hydrogenase expression/formation protein HypD
MGAIAGSGLRLREEYADYDAGSMGLDEDKKKNRGCCCGEILKGNLRPCECPLFGRVCHPQNPQGACMVSYEGSCFQAYENHYQ